MTEKRCSKCKRTKPLDEFHKNQSYCKMCHLEAVHQSRERQRNIRISTEAEREIRDKNLMKESAFTFVNGYTLSISPNGDSFAFSLTDIREAMAFKDPDDRTSSILMPNDRVKLLRDWLNAKL